MSDKQTKVKNIWEVPGIDLNLRHYSGSVSDVFKKIKNDIVNYLMSPTATEKSKQIYSAIYNALNYYEILSPDFSNNDDFLASSIETFNEDFKYLSQKYNSDSLLDSPVISLSARVKSPLSFVEKVKDKVNEYLVENRDFVYFNESLRDIIGVRVIVDPPHCIKYQGLQAESDYLYDVFYDLMNYRGIMENESYPSVGKFKFLNVNTRYDKNKLEKMKSVKYPGKVISTADTPTDEDKKLLSNYGCIIKPETRPSYMEEIDSKVKDYHFYPKKSGYQSIHICVVPNFSSHVKRPKLPSCIIPPASSDYSIEYQFRNAREDDFSNKGPASHGKLKPFEKIYHRLAIPSFIEADDLIPTPSKISIRKLLKPRNFGENYQRFYGPSFEDRFNISYNMFNHTFDEDTQNDILAERKIVSFTESTHTYSAIDNPIPVCVEESDRDSLDSSSTIVDFLERAHLSDSTLVPTGTNGISTESHRKKNNIKLYKLLPASRIKSKNIQQSPTFSKKRKLLAKKPKVKDDAPGFDDDL